MLKNVFYWLLLILVWIFIWQFAIYWLEIETNLDNAVYYIRQIFLTDDGSSNTPTSITLNWKTWDIWLNWNLNIKTGAIKDWTVTSADIQDWAINPDDINSLEEYEMWWLMILPLTDMGSWWKLNFQVEWKVWAKQYCDERWDNCLTISEIINNKSDSWKLDSESVNQDLNKELSSSQWIDELDNGVQLKLQDQTNKSGSSSFMEISSLPIKWKLSVVNRNNRLLLIDSTNKVMEWDWQDLKFITKLSIPVWNRDYDIFAIWDKLITASFYRKLDWNQVVPNTHLWWLDNNRWVIEYNQLMLKDRFYGISDIVHFKSWNDDYICISSLSYDSATEHKYDSQWVIMKWNWDWFDWPIANVWENYWFDCDYFETDWKSYIFVSSYAKDRCWENPDDCGNVKWNLYSLNGSQLNQEQSINLQFAWETEIINVWKKLFMFVSQAKSDSLIFKWQGNKFLESQKIKTYWLSTAESFVHNWIYYFVYSVKDVWFKILKYDMDKEVFNEFLTVNDIIDVNLISFERLWDIDYLVVWNSQESRIYKIWF